MFYGQFVLSKKGPLSKIWLAAHWERKLSKAQIFETNVQDAVEEILKPKVKLSLRTTGHLLLGLVRIYSRKAKYVLDDCNEAFLKIKMAFRPGAASETEFRERERDEGADIPEVLHDFYEALPDFQDLESVMGTIAGIGNYQANQSRLDEITLNEEHSNVASQRNFFGLDNDVLGDDDFGEREQQLHGIDEEEDEDVEAARRHSNRTNDISNRPSTSNANNLLLEDDFGPKSNLMFGGMDDEAGTAEDLDIMFDQNYLENDSVVDGQALGQAKKPVAAMESFTLEPLDTAALQRQHQEKAGRGKRKRRLVIDEPKNISGDEIKANLSNYKDTIAPMDMAPPTKQIMRMRESAVVDKILNLPGCSSATHNQQILRLYQSHLVLHAKELDESERHSTISDVRRDLDMVDHLDDDHYSNQEYDFGAPHTPIVENGVAPAGDEDTDDAHGSASKGGSAEKKSRKSRAHERDEEEEEEDEQMFSRRTKNILHSIAVKLNANNDKILFEDLFTKGSTRRTAAQKFYAMLELHKWQAIAVEQSEPFGEIEICPGPRMNELLTSA